MNVLNELSAPPIHPDARIGRNVQIGPFVTIEADVEIGDNCIIHSNVVIGSGTRMGDNCKVFPGAIVGTIPQDLKFDDERTYLEIGNNVVIREYCTLNKGTNESGKTVIKDNCLLMAYSHVAHDCVVGKNCIFANNATLGGHVKIGDYVRIGGLAAVHQFCKIGSYAFVAGGTMVRKDIPPYIKMGHNPNTYLGVNSIGLDRAGFSKEDIHHIQDIYRVLFVKKGFNTTRALAYIQTEIKDSPLRQQILNFVANAERGILKRIK